MTVIYLPECSTRCYGVTFENIGCFNVQRYEVISDDENNILCVKRLRTFLGKSEVCDMTLMSGALDESVFDGNTVLLKISENDRYRYVFIGGDMICSFLTNDDIHQYISNMGNILNPYSIAVGQEIVYSSTPHFKFIKREDY